MFNFKKIRQDGISLRKVHGWLIIIAILVSAVLIYATFHTFSSFMRLSDATDEYIELQKATYEMMEASDYLTEMSQRFSVSGDMDYVDNYFKEIYEDLRREKALSTMKANPAALKELQLAMQASEKLMERETYSMKLVIEARELKYYPEVLDTIELKSADRQLRPGEKMKLASTMVLGKEYYNYKEKIRSHLKSTLAELEENTHGKQTQYSTGLLKEFNAVRITIILQTIGIMFMIWLTSHLGINPVLKAVDKIKEDSPLPVIGANEFRYLASTYNKMYEVYKKSIEHLNYKASHDELTKVYNRAGYNVLLSGIDLDSTFMLLIDADYFKEINDQYGHDTGDRILIKIADTVKCYFRSDDYVCRIGGDEFVVLMVHADENNEDLITSKIQRINTRLSNTDDGLPPITLSVGIAHGKNAADAKTLFEHADEALYKAKENGRNTFVFYRG